MKKSVKTALLLVLVIAAICLAAVINPAIFGLVLVAGLFKAASHFIIKKRDEKRKNLWFNGTQADRDAMSPSEKELLRWMKEPDCADQNQRK